MAEGQVGKRAAIGTLTAALSSVVMQQVRPEQRQRIEPFADRLEPLPAAAPDSRCFGAAGR